MRSLRHPCIPGLTDELENLNIASPSLPKPHEGGRSQQANEKVPVISIEDSPKECVAQPAKKARVDKQKLERLEYLKLHVCIASPACFFTTCHMSPDPNLL